MARTRHSELFCVLGIFLILLHLVTVIKSDTSEEVILTNQELYERQKRAFGDSLEYGFLNTDENKRLEDPETQTQDERRHIDISITRLNVRKRSASGSDPYGLIAGISGGSVIHSDKGNVSSAVDILTTTLTNSVIITRNTIKMATSGNVQFYVDNSMTKLAVGIEISCCRPTVILTDPTGKELTTSSENVTLKVDTTSLVYLDIARKLRPGNWSVSVSSAKSQEYDVTIYGSSLVNFDLDFSDNMGSPISGQPIPDSNSTYVKITPLGADKVSNWTSLLIKDIDGTLLQTLPLGALRGSRTSKAFLLPVRWPNTDVHVGVTGIDTDGNRFTREQRTLVQPLGVRLLLDKAGSDYITSCHTPYVIDFTVTNTGASANFTFQVSSDNNNFKVTVSPVNIRIISKGTARGQARVTLISTPTAGYTAQILISVLDSTMKAQYVTKTLIAKDVTCPDTGTHHYMGPSTPANSSMSFTITSANIVLSTTILILLRMFMNVE